MEGEVTHAKRVEVAWLMLTWVGSRELGIVSEQKWPLSWILKYEKDFFFSFQISKGLEETTQPEDKDVNGMPRAWHSAHCSGGSWEIFAELLQSHGEQERVGER